MRENLIVLFFAALLGTTKTWTSAKVIVRRVHQQENGGLIVRSKLYLKLENIRNGNFRYSVTVRYKNIRRKCCAPHHGVFAPRESRRKGDTGEQYKAGLLQNLYYLIS